MAPFRWPELSHDKALLLEVATKKPERPADWEDIALNLSLAFSMPNKRASLQGKVGPFDSQVQKRRCKGTEKVNINIYIVYLMNIYVYKLAFKKL